jgi:hypothetical protein
MCPLTKAEKRLSDCAEFWKQAEASYQVPITFVRDTQATIQGLRSVRVWRERHTIYSVRGVTFESPDRLNYRGKGRAVPENDQKDDHRSLPFGISYSNAYRSKATDSRFQRFQYLVNWKRINAVTERGSDCAPRLINLYCPDRWMQRVFSVLFFITEASKRLSQP